MLYYVLSAATVYSDELYWYVLPYSVKVWRGESLVNLANRPWFTKLKPSKLVLKVNNLLADLLADLLIYQTFFRQMLETSQFAKFYPTKLSHIRYTLG